MEDPQSAESLPTQRSDAFAGDHKSMQLLTAYDAFP